MKWPTSICIFQLALIIRTWHHEKCIQPQQIVSLMLYLHPFEGCSISMSGVEIKHKSQMKKFQHHPKSYIAKIHPNSSLQKPQSKFSIKDDARNQFQICSLWMLELYGKFFSLAGDDICLGTTSIVCTIVHENNMKNKDRR